VASSPYSEGSDSGHVRSDRRIHGFDWLRVIGVAAVVGIHCFYTDRALSWLPRNFSFAVPCFVLMAAFLSARELDAGKTGVAFLKHRFARLLPAFLAWTSIYVFARWAGGSIHPSVTDWIEYLFLGASALHLYFIPMILYFGAVLVLVMHAGRHRGLALLAALAGAMLLQRMHLPGFHLASPEANAFPFYFVHNLPYLFAAALLFEVLGKWRQAGGLRGLKGAVAALACAGAAWYCWTHPLPGQGLAPFQDFARNIFLFLAFLFRPLRTPAWVAALASISYGVYLCHHLVIEGLLHFERFVHLPSNTAWVTVSRFACGLVLSAGLSFLLSRHRFTAWLVR